MVGSAQIAIAMRRPNVAYVKFKKSWPDELTVSEFAQRMKSVRDDFRQFSLSLKRADIAYQADNAAKQHIAFYAARQRYLQESDNDFISIKILLLNAFSYATLMQLGGLVAAFGLVSLLLGRAPHINVASRQTWIVTGFASAICLAAFLAAYFWNRVKDGGMHMDEPISGWGSYGLAIFGLAPFVLVPLLAGCVASFAKRPLKLEWMPSTTSSTRSASLLAQRFGAICIFLWWSVPIYVAIYCFVALLASIFGFSLRDVSVPLLGEFDFNEWMGKLFAVVLGLAVLSGLWRFFGAFWFGAPQKMWRLNFAMRLCGRAWIAFLLISSVFWLLFSVVSLPERARSEHKIAMMLQHGETWLAMR